MNEILNRFIMIFTSSNSLVANHNISNMFPKEYNFMTIINHSTGIEIPYKNTFVNPYIITAIFILIGLLFANLRKLRVRNYEIEIFKSLKNTFLDLDDSLIYLLDEKLNYVFANKAIERFFNVPYNSVKGHTDFDLLNNELAAKLSDSNLRVLQKNTILTEEFAWENRVYKAIRFPVKMLNDKRGVAAYIKEVTEEHNQIKNHEKVVTRQRILLDTLNHSFSTQQEQLDYVLSESIKMTDSNYGYIFLYDEDIEKVTLNSWTRNIECSHKILNARPVYYLKDIGMWGEAIRRRKPIIMNEFDKYLSGKNYPEGHDSIATFMSVPVIIDNKIVAVIGLANKKDNYNEEDVYDMTVLMYGVWNILIRREALDKLSYERNKYLQTLISIGDGVIVVDIEGKIEMMNNIAQKLTGWEYDESIGKNYKEILNFISEFEDSIIIDPIQDVFKNQEIEKLNSNITLKSKSGVHYYIENSTSPIKDDSGKTMGVVLIFRDITEKKEQLDKIEYLSFHDPSTGLYNRRFFEVEMDRLNMSRNLPISIIMGDVNGLKITNDIFGHVCGDMLLEKIAEVFLRVCRSDDIIARWGGDEFVLLLPNTSIEESEVIKTRIKSEFSKEKIKAIRGSISMGCATKSNLEEDLYQTFNEAEEKMYLEKTLEKIENQGTIINSIINLLNDSCANVIEHSRRVSQMCQDFGDFLGVSLVELRKLKEIGLFHDIGKVVLEPHLIDGSLLLSNKDRNEYRRHSSVGYRILNSFEETMDIAEDVLAHHEHWDGTGYPKGLKGKEIPKLARIVTLVESYDRLIFDSDNNIIRSNEEALESITENIGKKFDPMITELFIEMMKCNDQIC